MRSIFMFLLMCDSALADDINVRLTQPQALWIYNLARAAVGSPSICNPDCAVTAGDIMRILATAPPIKPPEEAPKVDAPK